MTRENFNPFANFKYDLPASIVVFLVALPLCLGIALASGAPLFSGLIAGIVGGIVVAMLSKSPLSVSGPAAGLAVIVLSAIQSLPSFEAFLLAVVLAGVIQLILGVARAGIIGDFIPSSVIKGMLAAIGLILILKQIPHAVGYDGDFEGDESFWQFDGKNTFSELWLMLQEQLSVGALLISFVSLVFLFWWDSAKAKSFKKGWLGSIPGPLVVVIFGVAANAMFINYLPALTIRAEHLVAVPVAESVQGFFSQFSTPDFSLITNKEVWITAFTLAIVASIETLLSIEAVDRIDPFKRVTPPSRELIAQGAGNLVSGLIGGLPITSVIVRSSANVSSGARTKASAIAHGLLLLLCVIAIPRLLNLIPLSALAAILISVGYKLTKPEIFLKKYEMGWVHLIPFVVTIVTILATDLLIGVCTGLVVSAFFIIRANFKSAFEVSQSDQQFTIKFNKDLSFIHKYELKRVLDTVPADANLMLDLSAIGFIDLDNAEIINNFVEGAEFKGIKVTIKRKKENHNMVIKEPMVTMG